MTLTIDNHNFGRLNRTRQRHSLIGINLCLFAVLFLNIGCSRGSKKNYPAPPETINRTADVNAKALQRALNLQKFSSAQQGYPSYKIGPNDVVDIKIFEHENMNLSTRVSGMGTINFPPLGEISVSGLTEKQLATLIEDGLRGSYILEPHVSVLVSEIQARMIGIIGAVNVPGQYSSFGPMRLSDLIARAGGLKPEVGEMAYVIRYHSNSSGQNTLVPTRDNLESSSDTIRVDLDGLLLRGEEAWNLVLDPSDLVNIPVAGTIFITGHGIQKPGTYPLTNKMTLQQLVDLAEGLKFEADHDLLLVRTSNDGAKAVYDIDYDDLRKIPTKDIQLRSGDKVIVDRTAVKTALAGVGRTMRQVFRIMISANYRVEENDNNTSED
jgi:polysaccharide biosynthesis/export protein